MNQAQDQLLEMIQLWKQAEDVFGELRIEAEAAISRCNDLTAERDEKGYRLLEAEERIQELTKELQRLKQQKQKRHSYCYSKRNLRPVHTYPHGE